MRTQHEPSAIIQMKHMAKWLLVPSEKTDINQVDIHKTIPPSGSDRVQIEAV